MIKEAVDAFLAAITDKASGFWTGLWAPMLDGWPLWWSWGVFLLVLAGCLLIGFFLQFRWARLTLGVVVLIAGAWLTGRHTMYGEMRTRLDAERAKKRAPPAPKPQDDGFWRW